MLANDIKALAIRVGNDGLYYIDAPGTDLVTGALCREEAIGCVASWIYGHRDDGRMPQFMEQEIVRARFNRRHGIMTIRDRAILVEAGEPLEEPAHAAP